MACDFARHRPSWPLAHPGLVESINFFFALLGDLLVPALNVLDDAFHVQVSVVVHLDDDRGVAELAIDLGPFLWVGKGLVSSFHLSGSAGRERLGLGFAEGQNKSRNAPRDGSAENPAAA